MKYVSFDIETAGLEAGTHSILEFGAVIDDLESPVDELPTFRRLIKHEQIVGQHYALGMHVDSGILKELQTADPEDNKEITTPDQVGEEFARFLYRNGFNADEKEKRYPTVKEAVGSYRLTGAGKNLNAFDIDHVEASLPGFGDFIIFHHRVLDPGPMYFDPEEDEVVPNLSTCLERAGLDENVEHTAVADSKDVVKLIRINKDVSLE